MDFGGVFWRFIGIVRKRPVNFGRSGKVEPAQICRHVGTDRFGNELYIPLPDDEDPHDNHPWNIIETAESYYDLHTAAHSIAIEYEPDRRIYDHYMHHSGINFDKAKMIDPTTWGMPVTEGKRHTFNGGLHGRRIRRFEKRPQSWQGCD